MSFGAYTLKHINITNHQLLKMSSVRAVRWYGNRDIRLDNCELAPLEYGQVRIAPAWCGICGSDLGEWEHGPVRYIP